MVHTEETKNKIASSLKGRKLSDEHRAKISERTKHKKPWNYDPERAKAKLEKRNKALVTRIQNDYAKMKKLERERDTIYDENIGNHSAWLPIAKDLGLVKEAPVSYGGTADGGNSEATKSLVGLNEEVLSG